MGVEVTGKVVRAMPKSMSGLDTVVTVEVDLGELAKALSKGEREEFIKQIKKEKIKNV